MIRTFSGNFVVSALGSGQHDRPAAVCIRYWRVKRLRAIDGHWPFSSGFASDSPKCRESAN